MLNPFVWKKYGALVFASLFTTIFFFVGTTFYGILIGIGTMLAGLIVGIVVGAIMLRNPFQLIMESKGLLAINFDSTGIIRPFVVSLQSPFIRGKLQGKEIEDIFNRETVAQIAKPVKNSTKAVIKDGKIKIELDEQQYNEGRFALYHWPVILWNDQVNSILTKDFFAEKEKGAFAEHMILYLNRKVQELTSVVRDFSRYVVEMTKPAKSNIFANKWFWIIVVIIMIILGIMFFPLIMQALQQFAGSTADAASTAVSGSAITRQ